MCDDGCDCNVHNTPFLGLVGLFDVLPIGGWLMGGGQTDMNLEKGM